MEQETTQILVVEDNAINMELATDLLEVAGYQVLQAETAEDGIRLAKSEKPDIILMDIGLPGMDGLEATRALKANDATRSIPVVGLTAHAMDGDEEEAMQAGCVAYITKPIDTRRFAADVAEFVREHVEGDAG